MAKVAALDFAREFLLDALGLEMDAQHGDLRKKAPRRGRGGKGREGEGREGKGREGIGLLARWGADLNATDWQGWTALHHAAAMGREDVCEDLKAAGADEGIAADGGKLAGDFLAPKAPRGIPRKLH